MRMAVPQLFRRKLRVEASSLRQQKLYSGIGQRLQSGQFRPLVRAFGSTLERRLVPESGPAIERQRSAENEPPL
jgi:hypothetical protein